MAEHGSWQNTYSLVDRFRLLSSRSQLTINRATLVPYIRVQNLLDLWRSGSQRPRPRYVSDLFMGAGESVGDGRVRAVLLGAGS